MVILACFVLYLYLYFCTDGVFSFVDLYDCLWCFYTVLIFALLVANWPFCIKKI